MPAEALRPLSLGELLDVSFVQYRQLFATLMGVTLVTSGPSVLIRLYLNQSGGLLVHPVLWLLAAFLSLFLSVIGVGATTHIVSDSYLGEELSVGAAFARVLPMIGPLTVLSVLSSIAIGLGMIFFLVPGIIIGCGLAVATTALVLERLDAVAAMKRSWGLTDGFRWKIFGALVVGFVLLLIPGMAFAALTFIPGIGVLLDIVTAVVSLVVTPYLYVLFTILYYDLRVRKEGFDLEMLTRHVRG
jgi:hypothetical protein